LKVSWKLPEGTEIFFIGLKRWPAKTSGAFGFGCPFLFFSLLGKTKERKERLFRRVLSYRDG